MLTWETMGTRNCPDCKLLGEMCATCGVFLFGMPEDKGREGPCAACPHDGREHLFFNGLCTVDGCDCLEHEEPTPTLPAGKEGV